MEDQELGFKGQMKYENFQFFFRRHWVKFLQPFFFTLPIVLSIFVILLVLLPVASIRSTSGDLAYSQVHDRNCVWLLREPINGVYPASPYPLPCRSVRRWVSQDPGKPRTTGGHITPETAEAYRLLIEYENARGLGQAPATRPR